MKIAIDATCWNNRRGFGRFSRELITAMANDCGRRQLTLVVDAETASNATFPDGVDIHPVSVSASPIEAASADGARGLLDLWRFRQATARLHPDAIFFPAVYSYYPVPRGLPTLVTIHDAIAESHPDLVFPSRRSRWLWGQKLKAALRKSRRIATVSENAKQRIVDVFERPVDDVVVIGEGVSAPFCPQSPLARQKARDQIGVPSGTPMILYVGGLSPHKNLPGLIRALKQLFDRGLTDWHMVFVGEVDKDLFHSGAVELHQVIDENQLRTQVTFTGYVSDEILAALYSSARLLVLPSFDEGFGLPAAEAMACGTPVAASSAGALPEVVGDAGIPFAPADIPAMSNAIEQLLIEDAIHARCAAAGIERAKHHRWSRVAERVFRELDQMVGGTK